MHRGLVADFRVLLLLETEEHRVTLLELDTLRVLHGKWCDSDLLRTLRVVFIGIHVNLLRRRGFWDPL